MPLPAGPSGGLTGLSPGLESDTGFWESTVARSWNPDRLAGQCCSRPRHPGPASTPPTLTPSEPACRVWPPPLRPPAVLLKLPLRSPPARRTEQCQQRPPHPTPPRRLPPPGSPPTCKRLPQHPDLLGGRSGPCGAASLGWTWFSTCSGTCRPSTAALSPGSAPGLHRAETRYLHARAHTHTHAYTHVRTHTHVHTSTQRHTQVYTHTHTGREAQCQLLLPRLSPRS